MQISNISELLSAITDLILFFIVSFYIYFIYKKYNKEKIFNKLCIIIFIFLSSSSFLGFIVHFINWAKFIDSFIWYLLNTLLSFLMAYLAILSFFLLFKKSYSFIKYLLIILGIIFAIIANIFIDVFLPFIIYEIIIMLLALFIGLFLYIREKKIYYLYFILAILFSIISAFIQVSFKTEIFYLNNNSFFHLFEMVSVYFFYRHIKSFNKIEF